VVVHFICMKCFHAVPFSAENFKWVIVKTYLKFCEKQYTILRNIDAEKLTPISLEMTMCDSHDYVFLMVTPYVVIDTSYFNMITLC
jgi:hypothetical protein